MHKLAITFSHVPNEWSIGAPAVDLNYGWGDHLQLTLQGSAALLKRNEHGLVGGLGGIEAAVTWRFLELKAWNAITCRSFILNFFESKPQAVPIHLGSHGNFIADPASSS